DSYPHCPEQWIAYRGSCYSFSKEKKDWHSSQESCWAQGAHLLVISDTSEM
ncbi:Killer cell lectin-like receptor subfamily G member 1, partial [Anas platyrhynchos]